MLFSACVLVYKACVVLIIAYVVKVEHVVCDLCCRFYAPLILLAYYCINSSVYMGIMGELGY